MAHSAGLLSNRDYYPCTYLQAQFNELSAEEGESNKIFVLALVASHHTYHPESECDRVGLNSIEGEMGETPLHCMPVLIECAILGSPHQLLTVAELWVAIKKRFSFYEKEDEKGSKTWWVSSMPSSPACSFPIPLHLFLGGSFVLFILFYSSVVVLFC